MTTLSGAVSWELSQKAVEIAKQLGVSIDVCRQHYARTAKGDEWQIAINGTVLEDLCDEPNHPANYQKISYHIEQLAKQAG